MSDDIGKAGMAGAPRGADRSASVYGNPMPRGVVAKAARAKARFERRFGSAENDGLGLAVWPNAVLGPEFGLMELGLKGSPGREAGGDALDPAKGFVVGTIRMGYGHYRIAMAMASVAAHRGRVPYWFDLNGFSGTVAGKVVSHLNGLYSFGSRLSQRSRLFDALVWEPLNSEGFKKLSYNAADQKMAELFAPLCRELPKDMPFLSTHGWPSQAAVHAGQKRVVNAILDNWPMALHLAEGALHTVQSPSSYLGYRLLREMNGGRVARPMPAADIAMAGNYVDHDIASNLEADTAARVSRLDRGAPRRVLFSIGGAGAQLELTSFLVRELLPLVEEGKVALYLNFGDHAASWERFERELASACPRLESILTRHLGNWDGTKAFARGALAGAPAKEAPGAARGDVTGIHAFLSDDRFAAVYATNLLMRSADLLVTKPSELAYYPVPKLMIKRVGGHERWGAIRAAELGDGSYELESREAALQALKVMVTEDDVLKLFNDHIMRNARAGAYDGAYRAVDLALEGRG